MTDIREVRQASTKSIEAERRGTLRRRVLKGAVMTFNKGYSAFECVVRNQSDLGAKLSLGETFALPKEFRLTIAGEEESRFAVVQWRTLSEVGVRFADEDAPLAA